MAGIAFSPPRPFQPTPGSRTELPRRHWPWYKAEGALPTLPRRRCPEFPRIFIPERPPLIPVNLHRIPRLRKIRVGGFFMAG